MKCMSSLAMLLLLIAGAASAQTGGVTGLVVDGDNNPVEGARVTLLVDGHCDSYVYTDATGIFLLEDVPAGTYTLRVCKQMLGNAILEGVEVVDGQITDVGQIVLGGCDGPHDGPHHPHGTKFQFQQQGG